jgi:hypothetical protein
MTFEEGVDPNMQDMPVSSKPLPVTVTMVPPDTMPDSGPIEATVDVATYSNSTLPLVKKSAPLLLTLTSTEPATADEGETQMISEEETNPATTSVLPKRHISFSETSKPEPKTVTDVSPEDVPKEGEIDETDAITPKLNSSSLDVKSTPLELTSIATSPDEADGDWHSIWVEEMYFPEDGLEAPNLHLRSAESTKL